MQTALRLQAVVLPGRLIEVAVPELSEGEQVELIILLPESHSTAGVASYRYPAALEAEYNALIQKKFDHTLTASEALRLQQVREEIAAVDQNCPDVRAMQAQHLSAELAQVRAELEALPIAPEIVP